MVMKLIAIDSSTKATGCAVFIDGKYHSHTLLDFSKEKNVDERMDKMITALLSYIDKEKPNMVSIEQPKGSPNPELVRKLSEILGAVRGYCLMYDITYMEVMPSQWRKWLPDYNQGGKRRDELKQLSIDYVNKHLGLVVQDDEADSINQGLGVINYLDSLDENELFE